MATHCWCIFAANKFECVSKKIDAPELKQPFGKESRESLAQICVKKTARVSWTELDRNGRTLGCVWCGQIDANAEQIRRGMAWVFDRS